MGKPYMATWNSKDKDTDTLFSEKDFRFSSHGTAAWIVPQTIATRVDLGGTVQASTHFLSKQARKSVAARHVSGNSRRPTEFAARLFPTAPKTKTKNRDSQTKYRFPSV